MNGKSSDTKQEQIDKSKPKFFIRPDRHFAGNDQLKRNDMLQSSKIPLAEKEAGVEFRSV